MIKAIAKPEMYPLPSLFPIAMSNLILATSPVRQKSQNASKFIVNA
jgi:hypothetical protein